MFQATCYDDQLQPAIQFQAATIEDVVKLIVDWLYARFVQGWKILRHMKGVGHTEVCEIVTDKGYYTIVTKEL